MSKRKLPYAVMTATAVATLFSATVAMASTGDFFYGDADNLKTVKKADVKVNKQELKKNMDKLYYELKDSTVVNYNGYLDAIFTDMATSKNIVNSVRKVQTEAKDNKAILAPDEVLKNTKPVPMSDLTPADVVPSVLTPADVMMTNLTKASQSLVMSNMEKTYKADGKTVIEIKVTAMKEGNVDTDAKGTAVFESLKGLKSAQSEQSFDKGMVSFKITVPNYLENVTDTLSVKVNTGDYAGLSASETTTYTAYTPNGADSLQKTNITYTLDSVKSMDVADRVAVYVSKVKDTDVEELKTAIMKQLVVTAFGADGNNKNVEISAVSEHKLIDKDTNSYVYTVLLARDGANTLVDNQNNSFTVKAGNDNVRVNLAAKTVQKVMLIDKVKPTALSVVAYNEKLDYLEPYSLLAEFSEAVSRESAEVPTNWVLNGYKLGATDVRSIKVLDIKGYDDENKLVAVKTAVGDTFAKQRNLVLIKLQATTALRHLNNGKNLLQAKSISDIAGLTDTTDNNLATTQDFIFDYIQPKLSPKLEFKIQSPEQYSIKLSIPVYSVVDASSEADLSMVKVRMGGTIAADGTIVGATTLVKDTDYRIVKCDNNGKEHAGEYLIELINDITKINADKFYHERPISVTLDGSIYDTYGNTLQPLTVTAKLAEDTISPEISTTDIKEKYVEKDKAGFVTITMTEPVQLYSTNSTNDAVKVAPDVTPNAQQESPNKVPTPTFEYVKMTGSDTEPVGTMITGILTSIADEHDMTFSVKPTKDLSVGKWKLVVRAISDDVGNTMATKGYPFEVIAASVAPVVVPTPGNDQQIKPVVLFADAHNNITDKGQVIDEIHIVFSRQMDIDAIRAATYDINGKQLDINADITSETMKLYETQVGSGKFFGDVDNDKTLMAQVVTIRLPKEFLNGDDYNIVTKKHNVITLPESLKAADGITTLSFDNNNKVNQFELKFDGDLKDSNGFTVNAGKMNEIKMTLSGHLIR